MRLATRNALAALGFAAAAACGNFSNEDLLFLEALPTRELLRVVMPGNAAQPLCAIAEATTWKNLKQMSDQTNGAVDFLIGLFDAVRREPPSERKANVRVWGPWTDRVKTVELRLTITRTVDAGTPRFVPVIEARRVGDATWQAVVDGHFLGQRASQGQGSLTLHFDRTWALGLAKPADPKMPVILSYDFRDGARNISARAEDAPNAAGQVGKFEYNYRGLPAAAGAFDLSFTDADGNRFSLAIAFNAGSEGKATGTVHVAAWNIDATWNECWDSAACLTWLDDPAGVQKAICGGVTPCVRGTQSACP